MLSKLSSNQKEVVLFSVLLLLIVGVGLGYHNLRIGQLEDSYADNIALVRGDVQKNNEALTYEIRKLQEDLRVKNKALSDEINFNKEQLENGFTGRLTYLEKQQRETLSKLTKQLQQIQTTNGDKLSLLEHELQAINVEAKNYASMIQKALLSVVTIDTLGGKGSGFIVFSGEDDAYVITSKHVIDQAPDDTQVVIVSTNQDKKYRAGIYNYNEQYDLALLKLNTLGEKLPTLPFGDSNKVKVGQTVFALGNPGGFGVSVTEGIISATNRFINGIPFMQTDSTTNLGNSGGPLINEKGEVIGMMTLKIEGLQDVNLALPSKLVDKLARDLRVRK